MPIFRGIEVSIVASREAKRLPEYPHPEGASVRLASPDVALSSPIGDSHVGDISLLSDVDPTFQRKTNPRISVYIPSLPGEHFWLKYHVLRPLPPATHIYFKMFMNGSLITSWGILANNDNSNQHQRPSSSTVMRALCEPEDRWQGGDGGIQWKNVGMETRYFHFVSGPKKSAAEDGGLIEVQVFRSKGRKRRAPEMNQFRNQERYGIASSSGGLIENPQDATYYDWLLVDPKDSPYATFGFHYRSMDYLLQLNLIPQSDSLPRLPRLETRTSKKRESQVAPCGSPESKALITPHFSFDVESLDTSIFYDGPGEAALTESGCHKKATYFLKSPPELDLGALITTQPESTVYEPATSNNTCRPLPVPPSRTSRHSSQSSLRSSCPSLTPSLAHYVDSGDFGDDAVDIGIAHTLATSTPSLINVSKNNYKNETGDEDSQSDYDNSPPPSIPSQSPERRYPKSYMSTTGSVLERNLAQFTSTQMVHSPLESHQSMNPVSISELPSPCSSTVPQIDALKLSESEWIRHTPSPIQRKPVNRRWSPRPDHKPTTSQATESRYQALCGENGPLSSDDPEGRKETNYTFRATESDFAIHGIIEHPRHAASTPAEKNVTYESHARLPKQSNDSQTELSQCLSPPPSTERHTWESCRSPSDQEIEVKTRPVGNWI